MKTAILTLTNRVARGIGRHIPLATYHWSNVWYRPLLEWMIPRQPFLTLLEVEGFKIFASGLDLVVSHDLLTKRCWERLTTELLKQELARGMVVLDIGANIGYFTLLAAKIVGEKGKVFAFEPNASFAGLIAKSASANGFKNVVVLPKAVSDKTGKLEFSLAPGAPTRRVEAVRLDDLFLNRDEKVDFIKMDIDGTEPSAFRGMRDMVKRNPMLKAVVEYNPGHLKRQGNSPVAFLQQLADLSFEIEAAYDEIRHRVRAIDLPSISSMQDDEEVNLFLAKRTTS